MKGLIIQLGIDLKLTYNILKMYNDIDRLVIDELFEWNKVIQTTQFMEGIKQKDIKPFSSYHRILPLFLIMYRNLKIKKDILYNFTENIRTLDVGTIGIEYDVNEIIKIRNHVEKKIEEKNIAKYDYIGFYTMSRSILYMTLAIMLIKQRYPNKKLIGGGAWFEIESNTADMFIERGILDGYLIGDGDGLDIGEINGKVIHFCKDLNKLKMPEPTVQKIPWSDELSLYFSSSRGCNFSCVYCQQGKQKFKTLTPENTAKYVKDGFDKTGVKIMFASSNIFFMESEWLLSFRDEIKKRDLLGKIEFRFCNIHPKYLSDDNVVDAIKDLRIHPFLGVESFCNETLRRMNKKTTKENNLEIVDKLRKRDVPFAIGRIFQFPGETEEQFQESLEEYLKIFTWNVHSRYLGVFCLFPNTHIFNNPKKFGIELKYFPKSVYNFLPEFKDYIGKMPYSYIDKTDPSGERFKKLNNKIRVINEKICKIFPL